MADRTIPAAARRRGDDFIGRGWVLDEVETWRKRRSERYLLITGQPGSGKTALAAWFAGVGQLPEDPHHAALLTDLQQSWDAVHFCVARGHGTLDPNEFTLSLVEQLSQRHEVFAEAVIDRLAPDLNIHQSVRENWGTVIGARVERLIVSGERRAADLYQRAVREPLRALASARPELEVLILVDALDEAVTAAEPNIVTLLSGSADLPGDVRFVLTTRNEPRVIDRFDDAYRLGLSSGTNSAATTADLSAFVSRRLAGRPLSGTVSRPTSDLAKKIVASADGNFLYATWVLDELSTRDAEPGEPSYLPKGLYGLYRTFLDRLVKEPSASSQVWLRRHEPFFGSLTVAVPAAPEAMLPRWLGWSGTELNMQVHDVAQLVEYLDDVADGEPGLRLYHRSVAEFFGSQRYPENGGFRLNEYYLEPARQHERIAAYYLSRIEDPEEWAGDWSQTDIYGLGHLVAHLAARVNLADSGRRALANAVYRVALDPGFQSAQRTSLGVHATLTDLRRALDVALRMPTGGDLISALTAVTSHRALTSVGSLSRAVFTAIAAEDFETALRKTEHYRVARAVTTGWDQILTLYVAWEAAASGQREEALKAVDETDRLASPGLTPLLDALVTQVSIGLAKVSGTAEGWLEQLGLGTYAPWLLDTYGRNPQPDSDEVHDVVLEVEPRILDLERNTEEGAAEAASARVFIDERPSQLLDPETSAEVAWSLQSELRRIADEPAGQGLIERAVRSLVRNPYPRYRDLGLAAVGTALLGSTDRLWVRSHLQKVLAAGLDDEGVTFTFDLPSLVTAEGRRRGRSAPDLEEYLDRARHRHDVWGTSIRALSADAAALFRTGSADVDEAVTLLVNASAEPITYAGYGVVAVLSLIDRCHEFGDPARADIPMWGPERNTSLPDLALDLARRVYDPTFRQERLALVARHQEWSRSPADDADTISTRLADMSGFDEPYAYLTHLSARWSTPSAGAAATMVKGLVPLVLSDSTALDTVLARVLSTVRLQLDDGELEQVIELTTEHLTTGRPWQLGQWR